ncbi:MAG: tRNA 5-hydroxyuridine methyltransferase [Chlamydiales bacterium]|nr:tRNA 5-hydroxyuridine methyltransferase [Chlamydiales bacterium]
MFLKSNFLFVLGFLPLASLAVGDIPEPYCSINNLPFDGQGWFANGVQLEKIIDEIQPKTVIEVGAWIGQSTRFMAQRLPRESKLYAVDTWLGSPEEEVHMNDPRLPHLYQLFLSNVKHAGLTDVIIPIRMNSLEAAKALNIQADVIYIDASHDPESVYRDIMAWYPHLKPGGVFCGDDWGWGNLREGVIRAANELNLTIIEYGWFWKFI